VFKWKKSHRRLTGLLISSTYILDEERRRGKFSFYTRQLVNRSCLFIYIEEKKLDEKIEQMKIEKEKVQLG